jgi:hypothetical protein
VCSCGLLLNAFRKPHTRYTNPKAIRNHAAIPPLKASTASSFDTAIPKEIPTSPNATELPMCPIPHKKVIHAVFESDHFLAFDIIINGT